MAPKDEPKLSYIPSQHRVRCEFFKRHALKFTAPPVDLLQRAKQKLEAEVQQGHLEFYEFFSARLSRMWRVMQSTRSVDDHPVVVTLAAGAPPMPGLAVKPTDVDPSVIAHVTIDADLATVRSWNHRSLRLKISHEISRHGVQGLPNPAQVHALWLKACAGMSIVDVPLEPLPPPIVNARDAGYIVRESKDRSELILEVHDLHKLLGQEEWTKFTDMILRRARDKARMVRGTYHLLYNDVIAALKSAMRGPERYGVDLPMLLLVSVAVDDVQSRRRTVVMPIARRDHDAVLDPPGEAPPFRIDIAVGADRMEATLKSFDPVAYREGNVSTRAILDWVKARGVIFGTSPEMIAALEDAVKARRDLNGLFVARGQEAQSADRPTLHKTWLDVSRDPTASVRDLQQRSLVRVGDLIAEIVYDVPGTPRVDVYGRESRAAPGPSLPVVPGDGVRREGDRFVAEKAGRPVLDGDSLRIESVSQQDGDVNLTSGNVYYTGDLVITGSVDKGTIVEVFGNLTVQGAIRGGVVFCSGDLVVAGGIVQGNDGSVTAGGRVVTAYIENSHVEAVGHVEVEREILGSLVRTKGDIVLGGTNGESNILASHVWALGSVTAGNIGRDNGAETVVEAGSDWEALRRVDIHTKRVERATATLEECRKALAMLRQKKEGQVREKDRTMVETLGDRKSRLERILETTKARLIRSKAGLTFNRDAEIRVRGILSTNSRVFLAGKIVRQSGNVQGVHVKNNASNFPEIRALEEEATSTLKAAG